MFSKKHMDWILSQKLSLITLKALKFYSVSYPSKREREQVREKKEKYSKNKFSLIKHT